MPTPLPGAERLVLQVVSDGSLLELSEGPDAGLGNNLFVGMTNNSERRRALVRFDVAASVPSGATIASVRLVIGLSRINGTGQPSALHRVTAKWGTDGDVTWVHRSYPTEMWETPGGDFDPLISGTGLVGLSPNVGVQVAGWDSAPGLVADVQGWLDDPSTNYGWIAIGNESARQTVKRFHSRENDDVANRPKLIIEYFAS